MLNNEWEGSRLEFLKILVEQGEEPAFLRRSRLVTEKLERLHDQLRIQRSKLLERPKFRLRVLAARLQSDWTKLNSIVAEPEQWRSYQDLFDDWQLSYETLPRRSLTSWFTSDRRSLLDFHSSVARFNRAWNDVLDRVDLEAMNKTLSDYNEYYPLEKTCAFGREDIERLGFYATTPLTRDELQSEYPLVALPVLRGN